MKDTEKTLVIFRKWKDNGSILALFPKEIIHSMGYYASYEHIGQHGAANYNHCIDMTVPARPEEYRTLLLELESIGYNLNIKGRYCPKNRRCKEYERTINVQK